MEKSVAEKLINKLEKNKYKMSQEELKEVEQRIIKKDNAKDVEVKIITLQNSQRIHELNMKEHPYIAFRRLEKGDIENYIEYTFSGTILDLRGVLSFNRKSALFEIRNGLSSFQGFEEHKLGDQIYKLPIVKSHRWRTTMRINKEETGVFVAKSDIKDDDKEWVLFNFITPTWEDNTKKD